ncbi:thiamine pyrophosphate enzyme, N-terminal TPP binding domain protein [Bordetella holmesii 30539]|uniref:Thiamine pyrophosphate enzyme, N-terminal TPP binding domain protein n=2 Tax=Bordetella holmesii TaxID=35814 RepID=A0A158M0K8_9BORD|nr:thiamine pyrophosphate enzyme, N-terminal TPP binding domain protein [Bordetella holmesii ATCC 51541]EWM40480.1 thiamine pyrophosphate enzyme, N-terminal TPP binding domain protein [Bordetella holmesii 35009]EWM41866.1 thiamine pyrophosphate enzyme, N-terminal TPP binding domain protein [Bordetella holmesii 41130]EWM49282.1 thiamine pyrophosphate enzyme, N-terminal TPP binding domain protein [Bordetella holmesii 70147]EXF87728.1 thiamine pyrophosphate enzyme, N-terminal TPP binding domain pr
MNGADSLCDTLLANDIDVCFANPGTSEMHFVAALDRKPRMRCVLGLFEGVVTGAADGYARMADKPAATLLHLGPGLGNGLANLHNARRARTPMVNVVGDHASYHVQCDAPLTSDGEAVARPMSHWVGRIDNAAAVAARTSEAIEVARQAPGNVATLFLPADAAWTDLPDGTPAPAPVDIQAPLRPDGDAVRAAAAAIRSGEKTMLMLGGAALRGRALAAAGRIAQATGVRLASETSNRRIERGLGRVPVARLPYPVDMALAFLKDVRNLVLVGARAGCFFCLSRQTQPFGALGVQCGGTGHPRAGSGAGAGMAGRRAGYQAGRPAPGRARMA